MTLFCVCVCKKLSTASKVEKTNDIRNTKSVVMGLIHQCVCVFICSRSGVIEKLEALELENPEKMEVEELSRRGGRQGRSEHRGFHREVTRSACVHYPHLYPTNKSHYVVNTCVISVFYMLTIR